MYKFAFYKTALSAALALLAMPLSVKAEALGGEGNLLGGYQRYSEPKLQNWNLANQRVRDHGGWQNYAMEPYQDQPETSAPASATQTAPQAPAANPPGHMDMKMHMHMNGHGGQP
ncbi:MULTISPECIES: hypothetical protein [Limnobacter]|uniref:Uncharacterized protein n=1 Tax=Limnobacter litoralis TaxID=481366 RepID=A0ABQ5YUI5_9BURK|nr:MULTISPECIES: hypothetical protein [Limnobacter]GLR26563.1 hypothetical protein GCM10007875_16530 [Limnobacter litoralis]HEX5484729.1 hypothetical protein [Limnobacter sp.]